MPSRLLRLNTRADRYHGCRLAPLRSAGLSQSLPRPCVTFTMVEWKQYSLQLVSSHSLMASLHTHRASWMFQVCWVATSMETPKPTSFGVHENFAQEAKLEGQPEQSEHLNTFPHFLRALKTSLLALY